MAKRKTKARKSRAVKARKSRAVKARKADRAKRAVRTVKAQTVFKQPIAALQNSFSSLANYFK